jgi:DNA-binding winged helix-turn-helix (wHTH) protein
MTQIEPGRFTKAAIHCEAGEVELRLSTCGNWQLSIRGTDDRDWRLACSGDLKGGAVAPSALPPRKPVRLGKLLLDLAARRVLVGDVQVGLRAREFELLALLASQPNRVFSREELMRGVWGYEALRSTRTLATHASRLRVKLRKAGADGLIVNCHGVGYKLWNGVELASAESRAA